MYYRKFLLGVMGKSQKAAIKRKILNIWIILLIFLIIFLYLVIQFATKYKLIYIYINI